MRTSGLDRPGTESGEGLPADAGSRGCGSRNEYGIDPELAGSRSGRDRPVFRSGHSAVNPAGRDAEAGVWGCGNYSFIDPTGMKYGFNLPGIFEIVKNPKLGTSGFDWEIDPAGTRLILEDVAQRTELPLFIIERGLGLKETLDVRGEIRDVRRIVYLQKQIEQARLALAHGVPLIGYCTWSAFDLASTQNGYQKRYGLIYVDREDDDPKDCRRIPKLSYTWFQKVIASNGQDLELMEEPSSES